MQGVYAWYCESETLALFSYIMKLYLILGTIVYTCHLRQITTILNWMCEGVHLC